MYGTYEHTIDAKGRLFIPARLREKLGDIFYVTISPEECLTIYSGKNWDKLVELIESMPRVAQKELRTLFSHAHECELDGQGRILLPLKLREIGGLKNNVTIVGIGGNIEIWDSERWAKIDEAESSPEYVESVLAKYNI